MSTVSYNAGRFDEGRQLLSEAADLLAEVFGQRHPRTILAFGHLYQTDGIEGEQMIRPVCDFVSCPI